MGGARSGCEDKIKDEGDVWDRQTQKENRYGLWIWGESGMACSQSNLMELCKATSTAESRPLKSELGCCSWFCLST